MRKTEKAIMKKGLMHDDCGVDAERWTVRKGVTLIRDATVDSRELERLGHCGVFPGRP